MEKIELIIKTNESFNEALLRFKERGFDNFSRVGSGYTHYIGTEFQCYSNAVEEADNVEITIADLFEYGKPAIIEENYTVYRSDYVSVKFSTKEKYTVFLADRKDYTNVITLYFAESCFGLGKWRESGSIELAKIANNCKPEVSKKLLEAIAVATQRVIEWKEAKKKLYEQELA